jgi:hypothetical protein
MKKALVAGVAIVALTLAGCGGVDRAKTKKTIAASMKSSELTPADQTCIVNSIDKYSDKELLALDKEIGKAGAGAKATSEVGKKYEADLANCTRGTVKKTVIDGLKSSMPDLTPAQSDCASAFLDKLSAEEFSALLQSDDGAAFGQKLAAECLTP